MTKQQVEARLKRAAGQVAGIQRMVEEDRYCIDALVQISAARAALSKAGEMLLASHVRGCVLDAFESADRAGAEEKMELSGSSAGSDLAMETDRGGHR